MLTIGVGYWRNTDEPRLIRRIYEYEDRSVKTVQSDAQYRAAVFDGVRQIYQEAHKKIRALRRLIQDNEQAKKLTDELKDHFEISFARLEGWEKPPR